MRTGRGGKGIPGRPPSGHSPPRRPPRRVQRPPTRHSREGAWAEDGPGRDVGVRRSRAAPRSRPLRGGVPDEALHARGNARRPDRRYAPRLTVRGVSLAGVELRSIQMARPRSFARESALTDSALPNGGGPSGTHLSPVVFPLWVRSFPAMLLALKRHVIALHVCSSSKFGTFRCALGAESSRHDA